MNPPADAIQRAAEAYLWAVKQAFEAGLDSDHTVNLARMAFEAAFQLEIRLLNLMTGSVVKQ